MSPVTYTFADTQRAQTRACFPRHCHGCWLSWMQPTWATTSMRYEMKPLLLASLWCVALCCSVRVSVCVLQCFAVCCSVLQCVAAVCYRACTRYEMKPLLLASLWCVDVCCSVCVSVCVLQCFAVCCSVLQCVAVCGCSVLQCLYALRNEAFAP